MYTIVITAPEYSETEWTFPKIGDARKFMRSLGFIEKQKKTDPVWFKVFSSASGKHPEIPVECKIIKVNHDTSNKN